MIEVVAKKKKNIREGLSMIDCSLIEWQKMFRSAGPRPLYRMQ